MKRNEIVEIKIADNAILRLRKDKILATVGTPGSNHIDIYVEGAATPFHVTNTPTDAIVGLIWGGEDE